MSTDSIEHIPFVDFGGSGDIIHFAHANGFPTTAYRLLGEELAASYKVFGMEARPLWTNSDWRNFHSWETAANDLIQFLDERKLKRIIGAGHSFGAIATVIAANKRPDLFSKLVLVEPVILPKWIYLFSAVAPYWLQRKINPVAKKASKRTEIWESRDATFKQFREKKVFAKMSDEALRDYVNAGTEITADGQAKLRYSKEWETRVYLTVKNPWNELPKLDIPFIIYRGETSDTITKEVWRSVQQLETLGTFVEMKDCGHLIPSEKPQELAKNISRFLASSR